MPNARTFLCFITTIALFLSQNILSAAPVVTQITPNYGNVSGGTMVTVTGSGFTGLTSVQIGQEPVTVNSHTDTSISITTSPHPIGNRYLTVTVGSDTSAQSLNSLFTFQGNWSAYIANNGDTTVTDISIPSNTTTTINGFSNPEGMAVTPDNTQLYVANDDNTIRILNLETNVLTTLSDPGVIDGPLNIAITPDGTKAYVTISATGATGSIAIIDTNINTTNPPAISGFIQMPSTSQPSGIAITPDGSTAYVTLFEPISNQGVAVIDLSSNTFTTLTSSQLENPYGIAITPNGNKAYIANENLGRGPGSSGTISILDLNTNTFDPSPIGFSSTDIPQSVAFSADGSLGFVTVLGNLIVGDNGIFVFDATNDSNITVIGMFPNNVAITPDSLLGYAPQVNSTSVLQFDTQPPYTVSGPITVGSNPFGIAITPDPSPVARFQVTPGLPGSPTTFDASGSVTAVGTITNYAWVFGDSHTASTASPIITHTYASPGTYTVQLTVTNSAGTSISQTFTGQTMSQAGSSLAQLTENIVITSPPPPFPTPPSNFHGHQGKNKFLLQTEYFNVLSWTPSTDPTTTGYSLFRNGVLIATIPASGPYKYTDHNQRKGVPVIYTLVAFNAAGIESTAVVAVVP